MTIPFGVTGAPGEHGDYAGDSPSAILSMLQSMAAPPVQQTPQGPPPSNAPSPQAAPIPAQAPAQQPHMLQRIVSLLGSVGSGVANSIGNPRTPQGYDGILTPDEIAQAKPGRLHSILAALGGQSPKAEYQGNLNNIIQLHGLAQSMAEQKRLDGVRATMATQFAPKPGETLDQQRDRIERMYSFAVQNHDLETAKLLEQPAVESIKRPKAFAALHEVPGVGLVDVTDPSNPRTVVKSVAPDKNKQIVNAEEGVFEMRPDGLYDAATGQKYTGKTVHPVSLAPNLTTFPDYNPTDPSAPPVTRLLNPRTGQVGPAIGTGKAPVSKAESVQNMAKEMLVKSGVSQMENADAAMRDYEQKLISGKASISGLSQFIGSTGANFSHDDPASRAIQAGSLAILNRTNPDLARYIRRGLEYAQGESQVTARPSDFRIKLSDFLSTANTGANADMIGDIQNTRERIVSPMRASLNEAGKTSGMAPAPTRAASPLRAKYDAAVAHLTAQGKTPAQIKAQIGDPP